MIEENSSLIFENSPAVMMIIDPETRRFVSVNRAAEEFYGWSRDELLSMKVDDVNLLPSEEIQKKISEVRSAGKSVFEFKHKLASGEIRDVEIFSGTIHISGKEYFHTVVQDVTERKRADLEKKNSIKTLLKQLTDYKYALDASSDVIITDTDGTILEVNDRTCELCGYSREELIGSNININRSGYHPDSFYDQLWGTIQGGEIWRGQLCNKAKEGSYYWVDTTIVPFLDIHGKPERYLAIRFDITREKEAEKRIEQNERWFKEMVQNSTDYFCVVDREFKYKYVSPSYNKMLGMPIVDLGGLPGIEFVHPEDQETVAKAMNSISEGETKNGIVYRFRNIETGWKWIESSVTKLLEDPIVMGYVLNSRDITDAHLYSEINYLERNSLEHFLNGLPADDIFAGFIDHMEKLMSGSHFYLLSFEGNDISVKASSEKNRVLHEGTGDSNFILSLSEICKKAIESSTESTFFEMNSDDCDASLSKFLEEYDQNRVVATPVFLSDDSERELVLVCSYHASRVDPLWIERLMQRFSELVRIIAMTIQKDEELVESKIRFELVQKATTDAVYDWKIKSGNLEWGDGIRNSFGYEVENRIWKIEEWYDLIHPKDIAEVRESLELAIADRSISNWSHEYRFLKQDDTYAYVSENGFILRDEWGEARRVIGTIRDISGRMQRLVASEMIAETGWIFTVEKSLPEALQMVLEILLEKMSLDFVEIWLGDHEGKGVYRVASAMTGEKLHEVYQSISDMQYMKSGEGIPGRVYESGETELWSYENEESDYPRVESAKNAGLKFAHGVPLLHADKTLGVILTASTRFKDQEIDLSLYEAEFATFLSGEISRLQAENELNLIFESAPDILCIAGQDGYFKKLNSAASELLEYSIDELLEKPYRTFIHPEDLKQTSETESELQSGSAIRYFENRYITKSGKTVWLAWTSKVNEHDGTFFGVAKDVTARKEYEHSLKKINSDLEKLVRELEKSNEELEQFAFVVSHDLQEPLRMITSFISQLDKNYKSVMDERAIRYIHFIKDGSSRMRQIIMDLLEYSRIGRVDTNMSQVDLNPILNRLRSLFAKSIMEKSAELIIPVMPTVTGSEQGLTQIFQNLISNALKYQKPDHPPRVEVSWKEEKEFWKFCVEDNGIGIDKEYSEKIFAIFQRLHSREEYEGSGVGLAICKKIIESHGGEIWVESGKKTGSKFCFTISKKVSLAE